MLLSLFLVFFLKFTKDIHKTSFLGISVLYTLHCETCVNLKFTFDAAPFIRLERLSDPDLVWCHRDLNLNSLQNSVPSMSRHAPEHPTVHGPHRRRSEKNKNEKYLIKSFN